MIDYEQIESEQKQKQNEMLYVTRMDDEHEIHCLEAVHKLGLVPYKDGDRWCVLWGADIQEGVSGFGSTVMLACMDFYENLNKLTLGTGGHDD